MTTLSERFGPAVKALRKRRGLTQGALAERCSLSRSAIGQFERGLASPSLETLGRMLDAIDADLRDLQRELDRRPSDEAEEVEETVDRSIEIAGVRLSPDEVDRRLNEAFDRLVRRSLESGRGDRAVPTAQALAVVKDE